jgi:pilus assembly protein Flp/PilA
VLVNSKAMGQASYRQASPGFTEICSGQKEKTALTYLQWERMMSGIMSSLAKLKSDTRAVTAMEYGMIAALIAVVIIAAVTAVGTNLTAVFSSMGTAF